MKSTFIPPWHYRREDGVDGSGCTRDQPSSSVPWIEFAEVKQKLSDLSGILINISNLPYLPCKYFRLVAERTAI